MIDPANVPEVGQDETLARYVLFRGHIRQGQTVKADAFMPPPDRQLSVTRHLLAAEAELWEVGEAVATVREKTLYGRADIGVPACRAQMLVVRANPITGNPNHAHVLDWPEDKPAQKLIAQELAAHAVFAPKS
ncbi:MAG: hypothetical protein JW741_30105 [Sedimentisphaerales bacterium]|nr:hypothetical protein [Sedimentisphaerales bacterium]